MHVRSMRVLLYPDTLSSVILVLYHTPFLFSKLMMLKVRLSSASARYATGPVSTHQKHMTARP